MSDVQEAAGLTLHRSGWSGRDLTKAGITMRFGAPQLDAIAEVMAGIRARGLAFSQVTKADFSHPALDGFLADALHELKTGPGVLVLAGFPVADYPLEEIECIYWGVGAHWGDAVSQSARGDLMGHVTDKSDPARGIPGRGYQSARELVMHCDSAELVGLLCVRQSKSGGENVFASSLRVYDIIRREHPEYLPVLERGFPYHRRGEEADGQAPISPYNVPVFSRRDGIVSCRYSTEGIFAGVHGLGREMTPLERAALDFFQEAALREGERFDLRTEPGEAVYVNNYEILHSRTAFEDWPEFERRRLLLRIWLQGDPPRVMKPEMQAFENRGGRMGIDHQPGRVPGLVGYEVIR
ncbi:MAG: TauD/TfdA family dioxygenase [Alphaproteobacteria bacterium]